MREVTTRHRVEYVGFRAASWLIRALPEPLALRLGELLGWLAGSVARVRMRDVRSHLRAAFPERSEAARARLARAAYRHLGRESAATLRLSGLGPEEVASRTTVHGLSALSAAVGDGTGALLVGGHLGNWEIGGAALAARGIPMDVVALHQANPLFDRDLLESRRRLGMRVLSRGSAPRSVLESLRKGRAVALVADQNMRRGGVFVDFFGRPASTARGPALLSLRSGAPLFLGVALRDPPPRRGEPQRYTITLERVEVERSGDLEEDVRRLTAEHTRRLQAWVERAPEQYFWHHRRWKTRPPGEREGLDRRGAGP